MSTFDARVKSLSEGSARVAEKRRLDLVNRARALLEQAEAADRAAGGEAAARLREAVLAVDQVLGIIDRPTTGD